MFTLNDWLLFIVFMALGIFIIGSIWQGIKGDWQYRKLMKGSRK